MHFVFPQKVLFKHCDPAGIVFFPRMVNDAVEALFEECLRWPFETMHPDAGVPTVAINMSFTAPSFHGDRLDLNIVLQELGRSSLGLVTRAMCADDLRFVAEQTLVCIDAQGRPQEWPEHLRAKVSGIMADQT